MLISWYSGICWYFAKAICHAASFKGGIAPETGFHSVIDSPDSVNRVMPPTTTMAKTRNATENSQLAIALGRKLRMSRAYAAELLPIQQVLHHFVQCDVVSFVVTWHYIITKRNQMC